jgi:hypothetical protein
LDQKRPSRRFSIDPRAEAYAAGGRSPYEPLRMTPLEWQPLSMAKVRLKAMRWAKALRIKSLVKEASDFLSWVMWQMLFGTMAILYALLAAQIFYPDLALIPKQPGDITGTDLMIASIGGLFWTNAAILWRTATR